MQIIRSGTVCIIVHVVINGIIFHLTVKIQVQELSVLLC